MEGRVKNMGKKPVSLVILLLTLLSPATPILFMLSPHISLSMDIIDWKDLLLLSLWVP